MTSPTKRRCSTSSGGAEECHALVMQGMATQITHGCQDSHCHPLQVDCRCATSLFSRAAYVGYRISIIDYTTSNSVILILLALCTSCLTRHVLPASSHTVASAVKYRPEESATHSRLYYVQRIPMARLLSPTLASSADMQQTY